MHIAKIYDYILISSIKHLPIIAHNYTNKQLGLPFENCLFISLLNLYTLAIKKKSEMVIRFLHTHVTLVTKDSFTSM